MLIFSTVILVTFVLGIVLCYVKGQKDVVVPDKKEHPLYVIYPFSDWVMRKSRMEVWMHQSSHSEELISALYGTSKKEREKKLHGYRKISTVIVIIMAFNLISILAMGINNSPVILNGRFIQRPDQGEGSKNVELDVAIDNSFDKNTSHAEGINGSKKVSVSVQERAYTLEEIDLLFDQGEVYLSNNILGDNSSFEQIQSDMKLITKIPGSPITIEWQPQDLSLIEPNGEVYNQELSFEGAKTLIRAILSIQEEIRECQWEIKIIPKQYNQEQIFVQRLINKMKELSLSSQTKEYQELPNEVEGYQLTWKGSKEKDNINWLVVGVFVSLVSWFFVDQELEKQVKKRKDQMELDYPEIINKFTLLVNAGMTIKQAWNKIIYDYKEKSNILTTYKRYAYEEMIITMSEIKLGMPEQAAYEQFGRRSGLISYIKFSSLISQNLKKGTRGFTELLMKEATDAFELRKQTARRLGEEAATKLLIPMMMLLIIVFMVIMIPAFISFQG